MSNGLQSYRDLGWELCVNDDPDEPWHNDCPKCGERSVTTVWHLWERYDTVDDDACARCPRPLQDTHDIELYWCPNGHMWLIDVGRG